MSGTAPRSRWMDWKPKARILADTAGSEPTKPSKPGFVGFEGATSAESPEIEAETEQAQILADPAGSEPTKPSETDSVVSVGATSADSPEIEAETEQAQILADPAGSEPTKPSKPGFVGFEGATSAESPEIEAETEQARNARRLLNRAGVRIMILENCATIGVWSDLDGPEIRAALRTLGNAELPIRYLDGPGVPMHYKARSVDGEPVPMNVLAEMEQDPAEPWTVRDRMLNEMGWCSKGIPWAEWKAAALNRLFQEQGATGKPGRITAATIRHGERTRGTE